MFKNRNHFPSGIYSSINRIVRQASALRVTAQITDVSVPRSHKKENDVPGTDSLMELITSRQPRRRPFFYDSLSFLKCL